MITFTVFQCYGSATQSAHSSRAAKLKMQPYISSNKNFKNQANLTSGQLHI